MASDGTSLEELETGDIPNTADSGRMQAILRDMNAPGSGPGSGPGQGHERPRQHPPSLPPMASQPNLQDMQPMPSRQPMPPMLQVSSHQEGNPYGGHQMHQQMHQQMPQRAPRPQYVPVAEEEPAEPKKNIWSMILEQVRDPLFVVGLFFLLSLPVFHTFVGKYASWAFAVGGQLSWLGLASLSILAGLIFALFQTGYRIAGF